MILQSAKCNIIILTHCFAFTNISAAFHTKVIDMQPGGEHKEGTVKVLECQVTKHGFPSSLTTTVWYHNKVQLQMDFTKYMITDDKGMQLKIVNLNRNDTGYYTCDVHNGAPFVAKQHDHMYIQVRCKYPLSVRRITVLCHFCKK